MSDGRRPGGLTALAVLNFVFGGFGLLGGLGFVFICVVTANPEMLESADTDADMEEALEIWNEIGLGVLYSLTALMFVSSALMIASGVGYLQQKKFLGRTLGNTYAVLSIASSLVLAFVVADPEVGGGFNLNTILGLIYPLLTLVLLNTTFKHDFVR